METLMYNIAEITRGTNLSPNERVKPKVMSEVEEMYEVGYTDLLSYKDYPSLSNTINFQSVEKDNKVYVNLKQKQKQGTIQKKDIILPITNVDFEPRFIMWEGDKKLNYIYHQKLIVVRTKTDKVIPEFLFFLLNTNNIRQYWRENSREGTRFRLVCKTVMDLELNIPSIEEQRKIVERTLKADKERMEISSLYESLSQK